MDPAQCYFMCLNDGKMVKSWREVTENDICIILCCSIRRIYSMYDVIDMTEM